MNNSSLETNHMKLENIERSSDFLSALSQLGVGSLRTRDEDRGVTIKDICPTMRNKLRGKKRGRPC